METDFASLDLLPLAGCSSWGTCRQPPPRPPCKARAAGGWRRREHNNEHHNSQDGQRSLAPTEAFASRGMFFGLPSADSRRDGDYSTVHAWRDMVKRAGAEKGYHGKPCGTNRRGATLTGVHDATRARRCRDEKGDGRPIPVSRPVRTKLKQQKRGLDTVDGNGTQPRRGWAVKVGQFVGNDFFLALIHYGKMRQIEPPPHPLVCPLGVIFVGKRAQFCLCVCVFPFSLYTVYSEYVHIYSFFFSPKDFLPCVITSEHVVEKEANSSKNIAHTFYE